VLLNGIKDGVLLACILLKLLIVKIQSYFLIQFVVIEFVQALLNLLITLV